MVGNASTMALLVRTNRQRCPIRNEKSKLKICAQTYAQNRYFFVWERLYCVMSSENVWNRTQLQPSAHEVHSRVFNKYSHVSDQLISSSSTILSLPPALSYFHFSLIPVHITAENIPFYFHSAISSNYAPSFYQWLKSHQLRYWFKSGWTITLLDTLLSLTSTPCQIFRGEGKRVVSPFLIFPCSMELVVLLNLRERFALQHTRTVWFRRW